MRHLIPALTLLMACNGKPGVARGPEIALDLIEDPSDTPTPATPDAVPNSGINATGLALQQQLFGDGTENQVFSPASISVAFGMLAAGARGPSADEIYSALHLPEATAHTTLGGMVTTWNQAGEDSPMTLRVANRVWVDNGLPVKAEYLRITSELYGAQATNLDFQGQVEPSRITINTWVEEQTEDRITDLIPEGMLGPDTRMVLTNAVYFKADWATEFQTSDTLERPFTLPNGTAVDVPTMHRSGSIRYMETDAARMVMLPYKGDTADFLVVLPKENLSGLEAQMTSAQIDAWVASASPRPVDLALPKFELNTTYSSLATPLAALGIRTVFSDHADLSGISDTGGLVVSDAIHKAFILVDETGTEAAAATAIVMRATSGMEPPEAVPFKADRPFWFAVRDRATGTLLFTGHVADPR